MSAPTYNSVVFPEKEQIYIGQESVAAGAPATSAFLEPMKSIKTTLTHQIVEINERFGYAETHTDRVETTHEAQTALQASFRPSGLGGYGLFSMLGASTSGGGDTVTGASAPYTHAGMLGVNSNRCNTLTCWHDTGDGLDMMMVYATIESYKLSWSPGSELTVDVSARNFFPAMSAALYTGNGEPTYVAPPSGGSLKKVGVDYKATPGMGFQANYSLRGSAGAYTNKVEGGEITITRPVKVVYGADPTVTYGSQARRTPIDIITGEISVEGKFDLMYDGAGAGTVYRDYLEFSKVGTSTNQQKVKFIDSDSHSLELVFWPITFDMGDLVESEYITASMTWKAFNDRATLLGGVASILQPTLTNEISAPLVL